MRSPSYLFNAARCTLDRNYPLKWITDWEDDPYPVTRDKIATVTRKML